MLDGANGKTGLAVISPLQSRFFCLKINAACRLSWANKIYSKDWKKKISKIGKFVDTFRHTNDILVIAF